MSTATTAYTDSMRAKSQILISEQPRWSRGTSKRTGERFWLIPSCDGRSAHYTTEDGCTCRSFLYRNACSHVLAVRERANHAALASWLSEVSDPSDGWQPIPDHEQRQAEAWQNECRAMPEVARNSGDDFDDLNTAAF